MKRSIPIVCDKFKVGDIVQCNKDIEFSDEKTVHREGQLIQIAEEEVAYFNVNHEDYDRVYLDKPSFYLYCNSPASSYDGKTGFVMDEKSWVNGFDKVDKIVTTREFAFAMRFDSFNEASAYNATQFHSCIVFQRKDL